VRLHRFNTGIVIGPYDATRLDMDVEDSSLAHRAGIDRNRAPRLVGRTCSGIGQRRWAFTHLLEPFTS
jgi:hypothetical protein